MTRETTLRKFGDWETVLVELDEGIAWVTLNRPEKRNCMSPKLNSEMTEIALRSMQPNSASHSWLDAQSAFEFAPRLRGLPARRMRGCLQRFCEDRPAIDVCTQLS